MTLRNTRRRLARRALLAFLALDVLAACAEPPAPPPAAPPPIEPAAPASLAPAPPPTAAPSAPDAGDGLPVITAGLPTIVAEAPTVTAEARSGEPARARSPGTPAAAGPRPAPAPAARPGRAAEQTAQGVIRSHFSDVEACYGPVAQKDPSVAGRIVVQWTLGADGRPTAVAIVNDTLRSPAVTECIRARARTWRFPPPGTGVSVVRYPFDLRVQ
ncbi:AgmX/PglI C-terminal domain-containing protein [Myxococcota bacterium]|nr:AgmX/PglI C-terminal domain-containing protein [Myxococcota bacterium]